MDTNQVLYPALIVAGVSFISWFLQWQMKRNYDHLDVKLAELLKRIEEVRMDVTGLREHNNTSHGEMWKEMRYSSKELGERLAKVEAIQGNCTGCRGGK
jgi:low affinity Fe/Cu permease